MRFSDVAASSVAKDKIVGMAVHGMVGHAVMLHEDEGGGGLALAVALAQYLMCEHPVDGDSCGVCSNCSRISRLIHPDVHFAFPVNTGTKSGSDRKPTSETYMKQWRELFLENPYFSEQQLYQALGIDSKSGSISVSEAKRIIDTLTLTALEGLYKVMIIWLPEKMNTDAANKLLKILEEPYPGTLFILVTHAPEKVIATIASRCRRLRVPPMDRHELAGFLERELGIPGEDAEYASFSSGGSFGKARSIILGNGELEEIDEILNDLISASMNKDLLDVVSCGERLAAIGSKEKQKQFCIQAAELVRKLYALRMGADSTVSLHPADAERMRKIAFSVKNDFFEKIARHIDRAYLLLERNVSPKTLFCDLANRFYAYI